MMLSTFLARRRAVITVMAALMVGAALQLTNTNPAVSQTQTLNAIEVREDPGLDPDAAAWDRARSVQVPLSAQRLKSDHARIGTLFRQYAVSLD